MFAVITLMLSSFAWADSISDEINRKEEDLRQIQMQSNSAFSQKNKKVDETVEPIALSKFRGSSDGWWQATVKLSNGSKVAISNETPLITDKWAAVVVKGNSLYVQRGNDESTRRQLVVEMLEPGTPASGTSGMSSLPPPPPVPGM